MINKFDLKKGDKCYVRMPDGSIAMATYNCPALLHSDKSHFVDVEGYSFSLVTQRYKPNDADYDECRFVCMTGMNKG